jgi:predicted DNA-binding transcriptional regulator AlpA
MFRGGAAQKCKLCGQLGRSNHPNDLGICPPCYANLTARIASEYPSDLEIIERLASKLTAMLKKQEQGSNLPPCEAFTKGGASCSNLATTMKNGRHICSSHARQILIADSGINVEDFLPESPIPRPILTSTLADPVDFWEGRKAISLKDLVKYSSFSRTTVYKEIKNGSLKARKLGTRLVFLKGDVESWLSQLKAI